MAQNRKDNYQDNDFVKDNEPFKNDLLDRAKIAQLWQDTLLKSGKHFVMAVDASWGMGKSYFARNWECKLLHDDYKVCYIDAFEYDFTDDPFMTISSSIIETLKVNDGFTELEEITNYLGVLYKSLKTNSLNLFGSIIEGAAQFALGTLDTTGSNPIINGVAKVAGSVISVITNSFKEAGKSDINPVAGLKNEDITYHHVIQAFKILLKDKVIELTKDSNKPFIVIVDELDRCKPTFAIEFLEKLKHLFDIPNIIFILFINRDELESIIKGRYGQTYDGLNYLNKFIPITVSFPTSLAQNDMLYDSFINEQIYKLSISQSGSFAQSEQSMFLYPFAPARFSEIIKAILELVKHMQIKYNLSLRDIKQLFDIVDYAYFKHEMDYGVVIFLRIIYLKDLKLYKQIKNYELENINDIYAGLLHVSKVDLIERVNALYKTSREKKVFTDILMPGDNSYRIENSRDYFNKMITFVESLSSFASS